jgi:hypothetical protein
MYGSVDGLVENAAQQREKKPLKDGAVKRCHET